MIKLVCILFVSVLALLMWCMLISSKQRDKAWEKTMKGKTTTPKTINAEETSESLGGKEKEGSQIYKTDLH